MSPGAAAQDQSFDGGDAQPPEYWVAGDRGDAPYGAFIPAPALMQFKINGTEAAPREARLWRRLTRNVKEAHPITREVLANQAYERGRRAFQDRVLRPHLIKDFGVNPFGEHDRFIRAGNRLIEAECLAQGRVGESKHAVEETGESVGRSDQAPGLTNAELLAAYNQVMANAPERAALTSRSFDVLSPTRNTDPGARGL